MNSSQTILVTGGAGFIGSNFIQKMVKEQGVQICNLDLLTYAGNPANLASCSNDPRYHFYRGDINDRELVSQLFTNFRFRAVVHFAAESHVDRSIKDPGAFVRTNVNGTHNLLDCALRYWRELPLNKQTDFRFLHVSTDEVYGSLGAHDPAFHEKTPYAPNSPYAASKAASDHLARAYCETYGLPVIVTNCSNNYGPHQFPEKLIPLMVLNAVGGKGLPVYGDGLNVRDWLFVDDHCEALQIVLERGRPGETYNVGGNSELTNLEVVNAICSVLDELRPQGAPHARLLQFVKDRPGHDRRYAINANKIRTELGWSPKHKFGSAIRKTIEWYLNNPEWVQAVMSGSYQEWVAVHYATATTSRG
jgi:dTDP-glucose 4,6-dehydratase